MDFLSKCIDPIYSKKVTNIMNKLIQSRDVEETILLGCINGQMKDFHETNNTEQKHNKFSIVEAENQSNSILTVLWKFSLTDKL